MAKPKKTQTTGYYTSNKREGTITVTTPSDVRLPDGLMLNIKGEKDKVYFWLVKQKVSKS